jgi:hypothetical protein
VRAVDGAGNRGPWSDRWAFSLSPQETPLPDLVVAGFVAPRTAQPGQNIGSQSRLAVSNQGDGQAGGFSVHIVISTDDNIDTSDQLLMDGSVSGVAPGESVAVRMVTQEIPADWPPGQAYIGVILDPFDKQEESNEGNNTAAFPIVISQPDQPPEAQILEPQDGARFPTDVNTYDTDGFYTTIGLVGNATDEKDGSSELTVEWFSDVEGFLGSGLRTAPQLHTGGRESERVHKITLRVTDSAGNRVEDTITVIIEPPSTDQPPVARILDPQDGARFADDTADDVGYYSTLELVGEATDNEDDPSGLTFEWYSDAEGFLGGGNGIAAQLHADGFESAREHRITLRVTDSAGNRVEDTITVTISPPLLW